MRKLIKITALLCVVTVLSAQTVDRSIRPSAATAKAIEIKDAKTFTLSNGLKVFVVEDNRAPIVYYSLQLDIKPALEGEKAGLQDVFSQVIGTATQKRKKEQLNKAIDLIGAKINMHARGGSASGLKKYESTMLELLSDMIRNPLFSEEELALALQQAQSGLELLNSDADQLCLRLSNALVYGNQFPKGEVVTSETLKKITNVDMQTFYSTYFAPNVARLVVVGNITEAEAKSNVQKYFGDWKKKTVPEAKYEIPKAPQGTKVALYSKDGTVQSSINVSYPVDFKPGTADAEAAKMANHLLGGGMSGKLNQNLREAHSYTYGVYSGLEDGELTGLFELSNGRMGAASFNADATDSALIQIIYEMNQVVNQPVTQEELNAAKAYLAGRFGRSLQEPATIAGFATQIDKYNLPKDYYKNYLKRLDALTLADVQAAAKKYINPANAWIVVVGDKKHAETLRQFATDKTVQFYDFNANPVEAPVTKATELSAEQIINNYVKAIGGEEAIGKITDFKMRATMNMMGQEMEIISLFKTPHYTLFSMNMGAMVVQKMVFDGKTYKISGMGTNKEITEGDEFESAKAEAHVCSEMYFAKNGYPMTVKGIETLNDTEVYVVEVKKRAAINLYYFDSKTNLIIRTVSNAETAQGIVQQISEISDYRPVGGVLFPFSIVQKAPAMGIEMKMTFTEVKVNIGLTTDNFK